jgi:hypothetical protein
MDPRSIPLSGAQRVDTCDDCAIEMHDWIMTLDGALLCFCCADFWEEVGEGVGA